MKKFITGILMAVGLVAAGVGANEAAKANPEAAANILGVDYN